jgi:hypothetical protein
MKEGREFLEQLLLKSQDKVPIDALAAGYFSIGAVEFWLDDLAACDRNAKQSESLWSRLGPSYEANAAEARVLKIYSHTSSEPTQFQENFSIFQKAGDRWMMANVLFGAAFELHRSGDLPGARQTMEQSRALFQECGDGLRVSHNNISLAVMATGEGRYAEARKLCEEALPALRQLRFALREEPLWMLGAISIIEGNYAAAKAWYTECLLFDQEIGSPGDQLPECLIGFASIASSERRLERAAQLIGAVESVFEARQNSFLETFDQEELERLRTQLRGELGYAKFEELAAAGRAMTMEQSITFALEQSDE